MDARGRSRLLRKVRNRRDAVAENWCQAIIRTGFSSLTTEEVRTRLAGMTDRVIDLLFAGTVEGEGARVIGAELADLRYLSPETLRGTLEALGRGFVEGLPAEDVAALQPRLTTLLAEIAASFVEESRDMILTEQEQIREALLKDREQAQEALRQSEASLARAQRIAHVGHWDYDLTKDELRWSDEIYRIFGVDEAEFGATLQAFEAFIHPEDRGFVERTMEEAFGGKPVLFEHRIVRPDGKVRTVQERAEYVYSDEGRPVGLVGTVQDITERKRVEEELQRRAAELAASNSELEHFASVVSHDLRAPLRGVNGFSQILLEDYADRLDEEGRSLLHRIRAASNRMGELIDDLLDLARVVRREMSRERVDLSSLARAVAEELRRGDPGREVEFVIRDEAVAEGDPVLLRAVLENLLGNAWKFTAKEPHARIEFGVQSRGGEQVYFVRDNGVGFDMAYAARIFGAFQRLHTAREFEGTGIGLTTVQRIIRRHGGRIWAEGAEGEGATFYFTL